MRIIRGAFDEVISKEVSSEGDVNDYIHIVLTDEEDIPEAMGKLRTVYPNIMSLEYDNSRTRSEHGSMATKAKEDSTNSRRVVFSYLQNKEAIKELFGEVAQKVGSRPGGYTRIIKLGVRQGDAAQVCFIELVDFDPEMAKDTKKKSTRRSRKSAPKAEAAAPAAEEAKAEAPVEEAPAAEAPAEEPKAE